MQDNKYFYKGIPITEYCREHDIKVSTIRGRIWKKLHNKKYENYSLQEIIDMVMESYGTSVKYMYKGISLRQYCLNNNINVTTINSRINILKKNNPSLTNDELVTLAMDEFENNNFKFYYNGVPLKDYCMTNPDINYNTIRSYINREKERHPELTDEELIEKYLEKEHKGIYKYYYLGIPLVEYCKQKGLNYKNIITYISKHKKEEQYSNLTEDEFIEKVMNNYEPFCHKYMYKNQTLYDYCSKNNISYYSVISHVKRSIAKGSNKKVDELVEEGIKTINRYGIIYYYNKIPLRDYAKEHNLNANSIRAAILRKQLNSSKPLQEIVNECVEAYQKFEIKYYYSGIPLIDFCRKMDLNYNTIIIKYLNEYKDEDIPIDEAIEKIVDYYIENPSVRTKYYFNNQSLSKFCDENGYPYLAIYRRIKTLEANGVEDSLVEEAIKKYEKRLHIDK